MVSMLAWDFRLFLLARSRPLRGGSIYIPELLLFVVISIADVVVVDFFRIVPQTSTSCRNFLKILDYLLF